MSAYIDQTYVENMLSPTLVSQLLSYGENTDPTRQAAKMAQIIASASDLVDSFLRPAGYDLPLATVPATVKTITYWLVVNQLMASGHVPISDYEKDMIAQQYGILEALRDKKISLPGLNQNTTTGTGGNLFDYAVTSGDTPLVLSREQLRGTFS